MSEADLQSAIVQAADLFGWRWYHTHDSRRSPSGWPDLVLVRDGQMIAFELKSDRGRVSAEQRIWIEELSKVPGITAVVIRPRDIDTALALMR